MWSDVSSNNLASYLPWKTSPFKGFFQACTKSRGVSLVILEEVEEEWGKWRWSDKSSMRTEKTMKSGDFSGWQVTTSRQPSSYYLLFLFACHLEIAPLEEKRTAALGHLAKATTTAPKKYRIFLFFIKIRALLCPFSFNRPLLQFLVNLMLNCILNEKA